MCKECTEEVSPELYEQKIKQRLDKEKNQAREVSNELIDDLDLWKVCNGIDIFGDGGT